MSREIRELSFAPGSSLQYLVRLSLGALAGIASAWVPEAGASGLARQRSGLDPGFRSRLRNGASVHLHGSYHWRVHNKVVA